MRVRPSPSGKSLDLLTYSSAALALRTTLYVDMHTLVDSVDQNGSAIAPYRTLTQAVARANASTDPTLATHFVVAFGDYRDEPPLQLIDNRRYVFDGVFRSSTVMRLPDVVWTVAGPGTNYLNFRNVEAGLITVLDGSPTATIAVIVYENSACQGINAAVALAAMTILMSGASLASFQTSSNTFVLGVVRAAAVNINNGSIFAQNMQFDATCPLVRATNVLADGCSFDQDMQVNGTSVELRESRWRDDSHLLTFLDAAGIANLDPHTQHSFDTGAVTLVNGTILATDQTYDESSVIPLPEGSTTGQSTFGTQVTFAGASYRLINYTSATHIYVVATAVSAPTTLVIACYQSPNGQTLPPLALVARGSLLLTAPGTFLVPLTDVMRAVPGVLFILAGKVAGAGNITIRSYTTPTQELLNDASVPATVYPTSFTTTIGATTTPPTSFNPTPGGGLVTPAGASNLTPLVRFATQ